MSTTIAATLTVLGAGVTAWIVHDLQAWAEQLVQRKHVND
jgi:hypothetical protein